VVAVPVKVNDVHGVLGGAPQATGFVEVSAKPLVGVMVASDGVCALPSVTVQLMAPPVGVLQVMVVPAGGVVLSVFGVETCAGWVVPETI
jgi:hypothetical protein